MSTKAKAKKANGKAHETQPGMLHTDKERKAMLENIFDDAIRETRIRTTRQPNRMAKALLVRREELLSQWRSVKDKDKAKEKECATKFFETDRALVLWCDEMAILAKKVRAEVAVSVIQ